MRFIKRESIPLQWFGGTMVRQYAAVFVVIILVFNLAACSGAPEEKKRYEAEFLKLFDTVTQVIGYAESEEAFNKQVGRIYDDLREYHQLYDIYHNYDGIANVKTINDNAGIAPVKVDRKIIDLLLFSKELYETTRGKVNIAYGAVLRIWHDYREAGTEDPEKAELPDRIQLEEAARHTNIDQIVIDEVNATVYLADPEMRLDVGAIAKGYATEQVARAAEENGLENLLISVGGNVRAIGTREDGTPWRVGVRNPFDEDAEDVSKLRLTNTALVTSGVYERYYIVNGRTYHHIIDPDTLYPADYFESISVLYSDSGVADALSTAVFNMPFEQGLDLIEGLPDAEALWVFHDGTVKTSSRFADFLAE